MHNTVYHTLSTMPATHASVTCGTAFRNAAPPALIPLTTQTAYHCPTAMHGTSAKPQMLLPSAHLLPPIFRSALINTAKYYVQQLLSSQSTTALLTAFVFLQYNPDVQQYNTATLLALYSQALCKAASLQYSSRFTSNSRTAFVPSWRLLLEIPTRTYWRLTLLTILDSFSKTAQYSCALPTLSDSRTAQ